MHLKRGEGGGIIIGGFKEMMRAKEAKVGSGKAELECKIEEDTGREGSESPKVTRFFSCENKVLSCGNKINSCDNKLLSCGDNIHML